MSHHINTASVNMAAIYLLLFASTVLAIGVAGDTQVIDLSPLVNCSDTASILRLNQKCFDLYDVDVTLPEANTLTNLSISTVDKIRNIMRLNDRNSTQTLCDNIDNYVKGYLCSALVSKKCIGEDIPILATLFLPEEKIRKQQQYICANLQNYNVSCVNSFVIDIAECADVTDVVSADPFHDNITDIIERTMCVAYEMADVCARKYLKECGDLTLQLYEVGQPDTSVCRTTSVDIPKVDTEVDCTDKINVRRGYLTCLVDGGITFIVPQFDNSADTSAFILREITLGQSKQMCSNLNAYKDAINCTLDIQRQCSDDLMKPTVPDTDTVQKGLESLCKHIGDFDGACVMTSTAKACSFRRKRSFAEQIILRHLCDDDNFRQTCMSSAASQCGARSVALYKMVLKSQSPAKCLQHGVPVVG